MNRHVVGALHERGVNRQKRFQPLRGETAGEKRRVFFGNADIEVTSRMRLRKMRQAGATWHRRRYRDDFLIRLGEFCQRLADNFRISRRRRGRGFASFEFVLTEAVKFVRLLDRRLVALAFFRQDVQKHRLLLSFQKLKRPREQRDVVSIDWPVVAEAEFFENHTRHEQALHAFLNLVREMNSGFSGDRLDESARFVVQMRVGRTRHDVIQVICNRAHVFRNRPFVVVKHHDEALGVRFHIVERFVTDSARERGIARHHHHVIAPAA